MGTSKKSKGMWLWKWLFRLGSFYMRWFHQQVAVQSSRTALHCKRNGTLKTKKPWHIEVQRMWITIAIIGSTTVETLVKGNMKAERQMFQTIFTQNDRVLSPNSFRLTWVTTRELFNELDSDRIIQCCVSRLGSVNKINWQTMSRNWPN